MSLTPDDKYNVESIPSDFNILCHELQGDVEETPAGGRVCRADGIDVHSVEGETMVKVEHEQGDIEFQIHENLFAQQNNSYYTRNEGAELNFNFDQA